MRLAILLALAAPAVAQPGPPAARVASVAETVHGIATTDPYRWMESPANSAELTAWVRAQSDAARARFAALPARAAYAELLNQATKAGTTYRGPRAAAGTLVFRQQNTTDRTPRLMVRDATGTRVLLDPASEPANAAGPAAINGYSLSPDGRTIAVHISYGGAELGAIRFLETATGRETLARIEPVWGEFEAAWLPGGKVAVTRVTAKPGGDFAQGMIASVGTPGGALSPVLGGSAGGATVASTQFPIVLAPALGPWALAYAANAGGDPFVWIAPRADLAAGKPAWRPVATRADRVKAIDVAGNQVFLVSQRDDPDGRVTRQSAYGGPAEAIATPPGLVLESLAAARDGLYVSAYKDGAARLLFIPYGQPAREVALPPESDILGLDPTGDGGAVTLMIAGWSTAPRAFRAEAGTLAPLGLDSASWPPAAGFAVRREEATSADGTKVPMVIVAAPGAGPRPTLLEAYGSYGIPTTTPWYNPYLLAWSARGNAVAYCGTRGGNERGRAWHDAGREANKPNAHADLIACAERLVALGVARPGGIAATGTSAGGLLAPVAVMRRPELFGALLPRVAILNPSRLAAAPNGANQFSEMGDPGTAAGYRALVAQDAYLALDSAKGLPPTLVTVGLNDRRVVPWMGAKFAAKAQAKYGADRVAIRADTEAGHGMGSARDVTIAEWADVFAWLESRLGAASR